MPNERKVYLEELTSLMKCGCSQPGCTKKAEFLHARCHPESGLEVRFTDDYLELRCNKCKEFIIKIAIAKLL